MNHSTTDTSTDMERDRAYQQQVDYAIAKLEAELPHLFEEDLTYDIYTSNIYFKDPVNTFKYKFNYRIIFWTLRFHGQLFFTDLHFDLHRVWQDQPDLILADWTVRGTLRLPWRPYVFFNGRSHYHLREDGRIYRHIDVWDRKPGEVLKQFLPAKWSNQASNQAANQDASQKANQKANQKALEANQPSVEPINVEQVDVEQSKVE